jgi:ATP-binding protein involved in chromosome partitioning
MTETPGAATPTDIELDSSGRRLRFVWADGRRSDYDWEYLRWRCPCASCSGEGEYPGELQGRTELRPEETEMVDLDLVGRYAVKPTWRNGHDTGLFTFRNLRALADKDQLFSEPTPSGP